jgi:hypothetical protein
VFNVRKLLAKYFLSEPIKSLFLLYLTIYFTTQGKFACVQSINNYTKYKKWSTVGLKRPGIINIKKR